MCSFIETCDFSASRHRVLCGSEDYYATVKDDPSLHVKLTGSWEIVVGEQDTFGTRFWPRLLSLSALTRNPPVHILEYENYGGYDKTTAKIRGSDVRLSFLAFYPSLRYECGPS